MMPHSIRGKVKAKDEGPRYCVSCHLTEKALDDWRPEYDQLRTALSGDLTGLDTDLFQILKTHIGQNPGNQLNSPFWVHMAAGLGSGLFLFDENGCPVNPLDDNDDRVGCDGTAPADNFDLNRVVFDLDRIVTETGASTGSNSHPMATPGAQNPDLRDGALYPGLSGPLGATLLHRLTDPDTGIVLDTWIDADGKKFGKASNFQN